MADTGDERSQLLREALGNEEMFKARRFTTTILRRREGSPLAAEIKPEDLAAILQMSMRADPNNVNIFVRAAGFYLGENDANNAEQCLSRASRLDRSNRWVAQRLSDLYRRSDRAIDALTVLDLCLREGQPDPAILFDAAVLAMSLKRNEMAVTYLDTLERIQPNAPWTQYLKAQAMLDLGRTEEAKTAIELEATRIKGDTFHIICLRGAVAAAENDLPTVRARIAEALAVPLFRLENLNLREIEQCLTRLWKAATTLPAAESAVLQAVEVRCLTSGLIPAKMLDAFRRQSQRIPELRLFVCTINQPLDERWKENPARLPRQENWTAYRTRYGVLAKSEDEAQQFALALQQRCSPSPATIEKIEAEPRTYTDHPGIAWREYPKPR